MKARSIAVAVALLGAAWVCGLALAPVDEVALPTDILVLEKGGVFAHPAETVASGVVTDIDWDARGRHLFFRRVDPSWANGKLGGERLPVASFGFYSLDRRRVEGVWTPAAAPTVFHDGAFLDDAGTYLAVLSIPTPEGTRTRVILATPRTSPKSLLSLLEEDDWAWVAPVPGGAGVVAASIEEGMVVLMVRNGAITARRDLAARARVQLDEEGRVTRIEGDRIVFMNPRTLLDEGAMPIRPRTLEETIDLQTQVRASARSRPYELVLRSEDGGREGPYRALLARPPSEESPTPGPAEQRIADGPLVVATGVELAELSPTLDAVAYTAQGALLVRRISPLTPDQLLAVQEDRERRNLTERAKDVALGVLIYTADYDDMLPPATGDWTEALMPYLRNRAVMEGFSLSLRGRSLTSIEDIGNTELGFINGRFGRAIAYADGSVRWFPNRP